MMTTRICLTMLCCAWLFTTGCRTGCADPGPPLPSGTDDLSHLEGETQSEIIANLGEPTSRRSFQMSECCSEFEIELYNTYRPGDPNNVNVSIRQLNWDDDGYTITVWFHRLEGTWVALDTIRYADDVEF